MSSPEWIHLCAGHIAPAFRRLLWASPHKLQGERIKAGGKKRKGNSNQAGVLVWPLPLLMPWRRLYNYCGRFFCPALNFSGCRSSDAFLCRTLIILSPRQQFPSSVTGFTDVKGRGRNVDTEPNPQLSTGMLLPGLARGRWRRLRRPRRGHRVCASPRWSLEMVSWFSSPVPSPSATVLHRQRLLPDILVFHHFLIFSLKTSGSAILPVAVKFMPLFFHAQC